jgi:hypothetical protein
MNGGSCFKVSNNKYFNSPALMADGRTFTDYTANVMTNQYLMSSNKLKSSNDYRHFLINNADKLMEYNVSLSEKRNETGKCDAMKIGRNTLGHKYKNDLVINRNEENNYFRNIKDADGILSQKVFNNKKSLIDMSAEPGVMCKTCTTPVAGRTYRGSLD